MTTQHTPDPLNCICGGKGWVATGDSNPIDCPECERREAEAHEIETRATDVFDNFYDGPSDPRSHNRALAEVWKAAQAAAPETAAERDRLREINTDLLKALKPFADFASERAPSNLIITLGSHMAKRQLTMRDCQQAAAAIAEAIKDRRVK